MQLIIDLLRDGVLQDLDADELATGLRILNKVLGRLEQPEETPRGGSAG